MWPIVASNIAGWQLPKQLVPVPRAIGCSILDYARAPSKLPISQVQLLMQLALAPQLLVVAPTRTVASWASQAPARSTITWHSSSWRHRLQHSCRAHALLQHHRGLVVAPDGADPKPADPKPLCYWFQYS